MDARTSAITLKALDGLTARSIATAENVANASTPHYRPVRVRFEEALRTAAGKDLATIDAVRPQIVQEGSDNGDLRLDLELATASETAMRYAALIEVLNRELRIDGLAVSRNG